MNITSVDLITWLIVGIIAGSLTGMLVKAKKKGFGVLLNIGVGLVGALIGGMVFAIVPIARPLATISINLEDLVAALFGSIVFLLVIWVVRKQRAKVKTPVTPKPQAA